MQLDRRMFSNVFRTLFAQTSESGQRIMSPWHIFTRNTKRRPVESAVGPESILANMQLYETFPLD
jgi:hypothetical protein